jgi:hypothetical protein
MRENTGMDVPSSRIRLEVMGWEKTVSGENG